MKNEEIPECCHFCMRDFEAMGAYYNCMPEYKTQARMVVRCAAYEPWFIYTNPDADATKLINQYKLEKEDGQ